MTIETAFNVLTNPNSKPAEKAAATRYLRANEKAAVSWFGRQSSTEESRLTRTLNHILHRSTAEAA